MGTERDTTKEHEMNSIDICSIYRLDGAFLSYFFPFSSVRGLEHMKGSNTFATDSTSSLLTYPSRTVDNVEN